MPWGPQLIIVRCIIIFVWQLRKQKLRDREAGRSLMTEAWGRGAAEMSVNVSQHPVSLPILSLLASCTVSEFCSCGPYLAYIGKCHIGMWHIYDLGSLFCWICNRHHWMTVVWALPSMTLFLPNRIPDTAERGTVSNLFELCQPS